MMDGTPSTRMCDWILDRFVLCNCLYQTLVLYGLIFFFCGEFWRPPSLAKDKIDHGSSAARADLASPVKLNFVLNQDVLSAITVAEKDFDTLVAKHDVNVVAFQGLGKEHIKKYKLSPDAFAQMVIQLAYYRLKGRSDPTYESAQTKQFLHGRTETCRTVSVDSVAWVKSMSDPSINAAKRVELLRKAVDSHVKYMNDAVAGKGVDRHLLGELISHSQLLKQAI
jgi:carnitine O-acetyltransferase